MTREGVLRRRWTLAALGVPIVVAGGVIALNAPPAAADSVGSCGLTGSGPAPNCSYQLTGDDLRVSIRSAARTSSTLTCRIDGLGVLSLSPGESGSVGVRNLSPGIHTYGIACSTPRGGRGGVSRTGTVRVSVSSRIAPTRTSPVLPKFRKPPTRTRPLLPSVRTQPPTTTTSTVPTVPEVDAAPS